MWKNVKAGDIVRRNTLLYNSMPWSQKPDESKLPTGIVIAVTKRKNPYKAALSHEFKGWEDDNDECLLFAKVLWSDGNIAEIMQPLLKII